MWNEKARSQFTSSNRGSLRVALSTLLSMPPQDALFFKNCKMPAEASMHFELNLSHSDC